MWVKKLVFAGEVVFALLMAALVVLIAISGGLYLIFEL
jgi:hypothetical protein